jgi:hypothetical protein
MTERDIISAVLNGVTSHEGVTNLSLHEDQVADDMNALRARMCGELDAKNLFSRPFLGFTQTIWEADVTTEKGQPSFLTIPRMVMKIGGEPAYVYIGGTDGRSPYRVICGETAENAEYDEFINKYPVALYQEGLITLYGDAPKKLKVIGVFERPSALSVYDYKSAPVYDDAKSEYPMPSGARDQLIGKLINDYIRTLYRFVPQANTQTDIPNARPTR